MRERTTWDRPTIAKKAGSNRKAEDPRAMNQDHLSQQPSADKYTIGGPSEFGEDVNPSDTWKTEYKGDQTDRNEIGMPNFRPETFKNASKEALAKKALLCVKIATAMLKNASEQMIEDQSLDFMHLSDAALIDTANRLAGIVSAKDASDDDEDGDDEDDKKDDAQSKQAKDASDDDSEDEKKDDDKAEQAKQAGEVPPQFLENIKKKKDEAKDGDDDKKDDDKEQQKKEASMTLARQAVRAIRANDKASATKLIASITKQASGQDVQGQVQQMLQQAMQDEQASQQQDDMFAQQMADQMAQQMGQPQQQQMAQQGQPQQGQPQQGQPQQQMSQCQDDGYLLDQMLQDDPAQQVFASDEIQMEGAQMDLGDAVLTDADDALRSLFAHSEEYQNAIKAAEYQGLSVPAPVTANTRTASSRTIGTRPSKGVPALGGTPVSGGPNGTSEVDNISSLWRTDPDVSNVFR